MDVDRTVVVPTDKGSVCGRRLAQFLDLVPQRSNMVTGFSQCVREFLVLRHSLRELPLCLEETFLEESNSLGHVLETTP